METVKQIIHHTFMLAACFCCLGRYMPWAGDHAWLRQ